MSNSTLKILAIIFMTIDHIGHFMPNSELYTPMRMVGRLAFPIFLFLILQGYKHTKDVKHYILNLYIFALLSTYPFYYAFGFYFNVFFTLGTVVLMLYLFTKTKNKIQNFIIFLLLFLISKPFDWGQPAILTVYLIKDYLNNNSKLATKLPMTLGIVTWVNYVTEFEFSFLKDFFLGVITLESIIMTSLNYSVYIAAILFATPFLTAYNGERGFRLTAYKKYFFYLYYPLHLIVIATFFKFFV